MGNFHPPTPRGALPTHLPCTRHQLSLRGAGKATAYHRKNVPPMPSLLHVPTPVCKQRQTMAPQLGNFQAPALFAARVPPSPNPLAMGVRSAPACRCSICHRPPPVPPQISYPPHGSPTRQPLGRAAPRVPVLPRQGSTRQPPHAPIREKIGLISLL